MTVAYFNTLTAYPSPEPGALLDQCYLHLRVFAREVKGRGESCNTSTEDHDVVIAT